ncbi:SubName: Full=Uncharacterized protein {ECO:0000313/EMBL:CCA70240.1} [Serendipita indica DSM 11827]|uniref:Uncharacterized protein n=1 Tax=Serendipita indica (strain DSM 11827) TaxID=1109443 RepID=G4TG09_SERID|nr:SubName: Full=Uncharacterized protein {ECO:0000313/EMBL:CCA70240.1} [Serendipita indica DSM 11827]CCA70240.1 hypothetical protein PIIN_04179 [Serendipita indica DSM 11827]
MSNLAIIDDTNPAILYSPGSWVATSTDTNREYNSTLHYATSPGATITYQFRGRSGISSFDSIVKLTCKGTGIFVYGTITQPVTNGYPKATYQIDNARPVVNWNTAGMLQDAVSTQSHVTLFKSPQYPYGDHTITISVDQVDPTTTGRFNFDFFVVTAVTEEDARRAGGLIIVDDKEPVIQYGNGWTYTGGNKAEYLLMVHGSPAGVDAIASFPFTGTSVSVYATLDGDYASRPIASFAVDGGTPDEVVRTFTGPGRVTRQCNTQLLGLSGLADTSHTLTITALGRNLPGWRLDYIIYGTPFPAHGTGTSIASGGSIGGEGSGLTNSLASATGGLESVSTRVTTFTSNGTMFISTEMVTQNVPGFNSPWGTSQSTGLTQQAIGDVTTGGNSKRAVVIGGVIGGIALGILLIAPLVYYLRRHRKNRRRMLIHRYPNWRVDAYDRETDAAPSLPMAPTKSDTVSLSALCISPTKGSTISNTISSIHGPLPSTMVSAPSPKGSEAETNHFRDSSTLLLSSSINLQSLMETISPAEESRVREVDVGIRLQWTDAEGAHDTLPPSYSNLQS